MKFLKRFLRALVGFFSQPPRTGCPLCGGEWTGPDTFQMLTCSRCGCKQPARANV